MRHNAPAVGSCDAAGAAKFPAAAQILAGSPGQPGPAGVFMLAPSGGLGGGIERYLEALERALAALGTSYQRVDLSRPGVPAHARLLITARSALRASPQPARLIVGHRALLPVAALLARERAVHGISVLCHGSDAWDTRLRPRRLLERRLMHSRAVRMVAVSSFTAGAVAGGRQATVLPPALAPEWFNTLVQAERAAPGQAQETRLVTVFRLADWRDKGLPQLIQAVRALGRPGIHLTVCGSGTPPSGLLELLREHPWCELRTGLPDRELAREFAGADLFVLATRTRSGWHASGEGFGMVLLEAQVAGTPVIAPAYGGSRDAYIDGVTGVAPVDESVEALAEALRYLLTDPARLAWMGQRAAEWAREAFDPGRYPDLVARRLL